MCFLSIVVICLHQTRPVNDSLISITVGSYKKLATFTTKLDLKNECLINLQNCLFITNTAFGVGAVKSYPISRSLVLVSRGLLTNRRRAKMTSSFAASTFIPEFNAANVLDILRLPDSLSAICKFLV